MEDVVTQERLDLERDARLHIISGGTRIVQHTPSSKASFAGRTPDNGCIGYVLRTGFSTSQVRVCGRGVCMCVCVCRDVCVQRCVCADVCVQRCVCMGVT